MALVRSLTDGIGYLTFNRPSHHNALSRQMWEDLPGALDSLMSEGAQVVVVTGQGLSFASGADLGELEKLKDVEEARAHWHAIRLALASIYRFKIPTIAMVNGPCIGGGLLVAIACDLRYASADATFGLPVARLGIVLDAENLARLASIVSLPRAKELLFTGEVITAARAESIGLVNQVFHGQLAEHVRSVAGAIQGNDAACIAEAKRTFHGESGAASEETIVGSYISPDFKARIARNKIRPKT